MTPEAEHEEGKRAALLFVAPGEYPAVDEVLDFMDITIKGDALSPFHIRGGADYFRELAAELEARADAIEATR